MTAPDIPEDIREAARKTLKPFWVAGIDPEFITDRIALALLSERTRATEAAKVRYAPAIGTTLSEMRASIPAELYNLGDVKLVWANEGDLSFASSIRTEGTKP